MSPRHNRIAAHIGRIRVMKAPVAVRKEAPNFRGDEGEAGRTDERILLHG